MQGHRLDPWSRCRDPTCLAAKKKPKHKQKQCCNKFSRDLKNGLHQKNLLKSTHPTASPIICIPTRHCICYHSWTYINMSSSPKLHSWPEGSLLMVYILWVWDKYITTYIHHYSVIQSIFTALTILCFICPSLVLPLNPSNQWTFLLPP